MRLATFPALVRTAGSIFALTILGTLVLPGPAPANDASGFDPATAPGIADRMGYTPQFIALPARIDARTLRRDAAGRLASPLSMVVQPPSWTVSTTSPINKVKYNLTLLGASPSTKGKSNIGLDVIVWRLKFANGLITDATKPACGDTVPEVDRVFESPLLQDAAFSSNGKSVGSRQYIDAFQTAEFAGEGFSAGWSTNFVLTPTYWVTPVIDVPASEGSAQTFGKGCVFGQVLNSYLDGLVRKEIQSLEAAKVDHRVVVTAGHVVFDDLVDTGSYTVNSKNVKSCCILGYHSAFGGSNYNQVYGVGSWLDPGLFGRETDIAAISKEWGDLVDDPYPYVNEVNSAPAWGHVGQVSGCESNFEVGDPLTGTSFAYKLNGFVYHLQELAFFGYFYREAGLGTGNKYSFNGTFTSYQPTICK